jgi:hypothetical protein
MVSMIPARAVLASLGAGTLLLFQGLVSTGAADEKSTPPAKPPSLAELWVEPAGEARDLIDGPGPGGPRPAADARYHVLDTDTAGYSISYRVKDERGLHWNVKIGPEAQTEVVTSRIVWALGYHQLPSYFVERWIAVEGGEERLRGGARFRPREMGLDDRGTWSWVDNPFVGSRPLKGLLVLMMLLNSTDLKDVNNERYDVEDGPREGARHWYVVKDLGASLGETGRMDPRRGFVDAFEREPFITDRRGQHVKFGFRGRHQNLLADITVADVRWTCERVLKITDAQWRDAFRAGGYRDELANRFITRIKQKANEGLALQ